MADDISLVRGRHQMSFGGNVSYWTLDSEDNARAAGDFNFNGQATGLGLADFLTGQTSLVRHGAPGALLMTSGTSGVVRAGHVAGDRPRHAQRRSALGAVLRAEHHERRVSNFVLENFRQGIKTQRFMNAPAG